MMNMRELLPYLLVSLFAIIVACLYLWWSGQSMDTLPQDYGVM